MRALIQRVAKAAISNAGSSKDILASIDRGMLILVGFEESDSVVSIEQMVQKIKSLRIFSDAQGKMNLAGSDAEASYLLVSQFTLFAEVKYGNRPSFDKAAPKQKAKESYDHFVKTFERLLGQDKVKHGEFGSDLHVNLVNDGPVTIWMDSKEVL
jgi:D-tyrosyl-tRNA(Tyr) deacylase